MPICVRCPYVEDDTLYACGSVFVVLILHRDMQYTLYLLKKMCILEGRDKEVWLNREFQRAFTDVVISGQERAKRGEGRHFLEESSAPDPCAPDRATLCSYSRRSFQVTTRNAKHVHVVVYHVYIAYMCVRIFVSLWSRRSQGYWHHRTEETPIKRTWVRECMK